MCVLVDTSSQADLERPVVMVDATKLFHNMYEDNREA